MSRVIDAIFRLTDEFSGPLEAIQAGLTDVGRQGKSVRKQIETVGNGIAGVGKTMTASITAPLAGLAATSYSTFEGVDKQLALVEATMGQTKYATADLSAALSDAAVNSIFTMEEGAGALVNYARQGFNAAEAANMLAPAMDLAAGTATSLDEVTSGLGNTLKTFGASSDEAAHYADMFAQAQAQANTDVQGLFDAMSVAGPVAQTVGWSFEDLGTLIGVFGDANISASVGATALKVGLMRLASPAKAGAEALAQIGLVTEDVNRIFNEDGSLKDMPELIGNLQQAFAGLDTEQQLAAASAIFGKEQASNWLALINGPAQDALQGLKESISDASGNAAEAAAALVTPTEQLKSTFNVFQNSVGGLLADTFVPLIQRVTDLIDRFRQLDAGTQQQIIKFAGIAAAAGPVLSVFGKIVAFVPKIMGFAATVGKAGGLVKAALAVITSPAGVVVGVLAAIVAAGVLVYKNWDTVKQKLEPIMTAIQTSWQSLQPSIQALQTAFGNLVEAASPLTEAIGTFLKGAFDVLADSLVGQIVTDITDFSENLQTVLDVATELINFLTNVFKGDWEAAWTSISNAFSTAFGPVVDLINSCLNGLKDLKNKLAEKWENSGLHSGAWWPDIGGSGGGGGGGIFGLGSNASGTANWRGGLTTVNESGGEIIDLPSGSRVIPHDATRNIINNMSRPVTVAKLADQIIVREDADIDRIVDQLCRKLIRAGDNMGAVSMG